MLDGETTAEMSDDHTQHPINDFKCPYGFDEGYCCCGWINEACNDCKFTKTSSITRP